MPVARRGVRAPARPAAEPLGSRSRREPGGAAAGRARHGRRASRRGASEGGVATAAEARIRWRPRSRRCSRRHILRDGELVLLILKPSLWFIVFAAMRVRRGRADRHHRGQAVDARPRRLRAAEVGAFLIAGRVMWAVLQWMGRLYVLTDLRVLRLSGVFNVDIFDCPLRKVGEARLYRSFRERLPAARLDRDRPVRRAPARPATGARSSGPPKCSRPSRPPSAGPSRAASADRRDNGSCVAARNASHAPRFPSPVFS